MHAIIKLIALMLIIISEKNIALSRISHNDSWSASVNEYFFLFSSTFYKYIKQWGIKESQAKTITFNT